VSDELGLLEKRVTFNLVDGRCSAGSLGDSVDHLSVKVGNSDGLDLLRIEELDHGLPGVDEGGFGVDLALIVLLGEEVLREIALRDERNGPVDLRMSKSFVRAFLLLFENKIITYEVKVEVFELELLEGIIESSLDVFGLVRVVPELRGDEKLFTLDTGSLDSLSDLFLVLVDLCDRVNQL